MAVVAVAVVPLVVGMVRVALHEGSALNGDVALIQLHVDDVGLHTPLVGSYGRFGWQHPGPLLFYVLALPYRLLGRDFSGLQVGALLVNLGAVAGIGALAVRRGGVVLLAWAMALVGVLVHALGPGRLADPWEPSITVLPLALLVLLAAEVAAGRAGLMAVTGVVATFLAQAQATLAPLVVALALWAGVVLVVRTVRSGEAGMAERRRALVRPLLVTGALVGLLWVPPAIEELRRGPGNVEDVLAYLRQPQDTLGLRAAYRSVALQLDHRAPWLGGDVPLVTFTGVADVAAMPLVPLGALVLAAALTAVAARRRGQATMGVTVLFSLVAAVVSLSRLTGELFVWILQWTYALGLVVWLSAGWTAWTTLARESALRRVAVPALAVAVVVTAAVNSVDAVTHDHDEGPLVAAIADLAPAGAQAVAAVDGPVLVRSTADVQLVFGEGAVGLEILVLELERQGVAVVVEEDQSDRFAAHRARPATAVAELRLVAGDERVAGDDRPPGEGYTEVATVDPVSAADRRQRQRLQAELAERAGERSLTELRELGREDPEVQRVLDRLADIEVLPTLTLLERPL